MLSGPLKAINLFQVNAHYFHYPETGMWIIDGGVELVFQEGVCCIAWSPEYESFVFDTKSFEEIYQQDNFSQLNTEHHDALTRLVGKSVVSFQYGNIDVETVLDYTMRTQTETKSTELVLDFDNNTQLQIAMVTYTLDKNEPPKDFIFDLHTHLLISAGRLVEISAP